jgi:hypothetical protein
MKCVVRRGVRTGLALPAMLAATASAQQPRAALHYGAPAERAAMPARITHSLERVTLRDALHTIAKESGVNVSYSSDVVPVTRRVSVHVRNATVGEALDSALAGTGVVARVWSATQIVLEAPGNAERGAPAHADAAGRVTDAESGNAPRCHARRRPPRRYGRFVVTLTVFVESACFMMSTVEMWSGSSCLSAAMVAGRPSMRTWSGTTFESIA